MRFPEPDKRKEISPISGVMRPVKLLLSRARDSGFNVWNLLHQPPYSRQRSEDRDVTILFIFVRSIFCSISQTRQNHPKRNRLCITSLKSELIIVSLPTPLADSNLRQSGFVNSCILAIWHQSTWRVHSRREVKCHTEEHIRGSSDGNKLALKNPSMNCIVYVVTTVLSIVE